MIGVMVAFVIVAVFMQGRVVDTDGLTRYGVLSLGRISFVISIRYPPAQHELMFRSPCMDLPARSHAATLDSSRQESHEHS
jgi:hypothetical protein